MSVQQGKTYLRFDTTSRLMHGVLMLSFITLGLTGIPIAYPRSELARSVAGFFGGFEGVLAWHKFAAIVLIAVFLLHLVIVFYKGVIKRDWGVFWGPRSMVPNLKDLQDIVASFKWFFGAGQRPRFDRYTYWEKFDYWAVFWGMAIIGGTGLMLWNSTWVSNYLPGWVHNLALIIHGEEALLAVWFIFTIHFFNSHIRPEKFPLDEVIFTGRMSAEEFEEERPLEVERLAAEGRLEEFEVAPAPAGLRIFGYIAGWSIVFVGFTVLAMTILAD